MKMNWGTGIAIVIIFFILSVFFRIYLSYQQEVNLSSNDYYAKGIDYQKQINRISNTDKLKEKIKLINTADTLKIVFPADFKYDEIKGTITFFRPSDSQKDEKYFIKLKADNTQIFLTGKLQKGKYIIKLEWSCNNTAYYQEEYFINHKSKSIP